MDMICFKEVKFEYRGGFANNFGRMKIKGVVIFPAVFSNSGLCQCNIQVLMFINEVTFVQL